MSSTMQLSTERVLSFESGRYVQRDEESNRVTMSVRVDPETVEALGFPETITVLVQSHDHLNAR